MDLLGGLWKHKSGAPQRDQEINDIPAERKIGVLFVMDTFFFITRFLLFFLHPVPMLVYDGD